MAGVASVASVQVASMQVSRKSIFHRKNNERYICYGKCDISSIRYLLFKEGKKTPSTYICRKMGKVSYFFSWLVWLVWLVGLVGWLASWLVG